MGREKPNKISVHLSIDKGLDEFVDTLTNYIANVGGIQVVIKRTKNEIYNELIRQAILHADELELFKLFSKQDENP